MYARMVLDVLSGILEVLFEFEESEGETSMREVICPICGNKKKEDPVCRSCGWKFHQDVISYQNRLSYRECTKEQLCSGIDIRIEICGSNSGKDAGEP